MHGMMLTFSDTGSSLIHVEGNLGFLWDQERRILFVRVLQAQAIKRSERPRRT